ncbi:putative RNA-directed DNA polymerase from mobile element jockey-like 56 [Homarus americanus]|uniref:Putative RNA-directed DNA polymerase from mobile element jockey-like 56 n=1 Tax=Homarus americanus TaxID=6706 RepID=A0A8J5MM28_HOMAM|nr:putative RNA-directed DNA polymerase from mobile element jockey-like 56 [Homarus americanus]
MDDELTSDHFATTTTLRMELLPPPPRPPPRGNTKKANWKLYQDELQKWFSNYEPAEDIDQLNQDLTGAIQHAAEKAIPKTYPTNRHHKDCWFYNEEVREQNHRINTFTRHLRQYPSPDGVKLLIAAVQHAPDAVNRLKLKDTILSKGSDTMSPEYSTPALWEFPPAVFNILQTGTRKADCNPHEL